MKGQEKGRGMMMIEDREGWSPEPREDEEDRSA